jgi:transcriptional regulator with XRE-family HTH domain
MHQGERHKRKLIEVGLGDEQNRWLIHDERSFADVLVDWCRTFNGVHEFHRAIRFEKLGVSENQIEQLLIGQLKPSVPLVTYLSAVVPQDIASAIVMKRRGRSAACSDLPEVGLGVGELKIVRSDHLQSLRTRASSSDVDPIVHFLHDEILRAAQSYGREEVNLTEAMSGLANAVGVNRKQLLCQQPMDSSTRNGVVEQLGIMLRMDTSTYEVFAGLAEDSWRDDIGVAALELQPRFGSAIRFLRLLHDFTQADLAANSGCARIGKFELKRGDLPKRHELDSLSKVFSLSDDDAHALRNIAVDDFEQEPGRGHWGRNLDIAELLGGYIPVMTVPDLCGSTPSRLFTREQQDNARLRALVEDGIVPGLHVENSPNPWRDLVTRARFRDNFNGEFRFNDAAFAGHSWPKLTSIASGRVRPPLAMQQRLLEMIGCNWQPGMSQKLQGAPIIDRAMDGPQLPGTCLEAS